MSQEGNMEWSSEEDVMDRDVMLTHSVPSMYSASTYSRTSGQNRISQIELRDNPSTMENNSYERYEFPEDSDEESDQNTSQNENYKVMMLKNGGMDVDAIPIRKDGMAVCEKCGAIGVKHAFYSKSKRFCSLPCSRSYAIMEREGQSIPKPRPMFKFPMTKLKTKPLIKKDRNTKGESVVSTTMSASTAKRDFVVDERDMSNTYTWQKHLKLENFSAVPVSSFKHAPLFECWDHIMVGMKVEVENMDYGELKKTFPHSYWVATVIRTAGYKALLRFEGFGLDDSQDFWLNLCRDVQPVGYCASEGKPMIPPKLIQHKQSDWKAYLVKRLTGARTLPADFHAKVAESLVSRFRVGMHLEVVDKNRISSTRVAVVEEVVGGRLQVFYTEPEYSGSGFWCHERSPLIHPLNWSQRVGHDIIVTSDFLKRPGIDEATADMFPQLKNITDPDLKFNEGMKLEAIDPLNLSTICVATVTKVLKQNYLMVGIDGYNTGTGSDSFCHHASSPSIFPAGFSLLNNIDLTAPRYYRGEFKWIDYLKQTKSRVAPVGLFKRELPEHGFKVGMKLEAVDLMEPRLICVATVVNVINRLLRIHFDGWDSAYDQWCDCESPDLYPVGYCEVVGYPLEPPRAEDRACDKKPKTKYKNRKTSKAGRRPRSSSNAKNKKGQMSDWPSEDDRSMSSEVHHGERSSSSLNDFNITCQDGNISDTENIDIEGVLVEDDPVNVINCNVDAGIQSTAGSISSSNNAYVTALEDHSRLPKTIPRLIDDSVMSRPSTNYRGSAIAPELWTVFDVCHFLTINDCGAYSDAFAKKGIDGRKLLVLSKERMVKLTGMKVGPSLKIFDLIQQLKAKGSS